MSCCRQATVQQRSWERVRRHMLGQLACLGRHTLTGVAATTGSVFSDWSAHYRLYSRQRFDPAAVFSVVRRQMDQELQPQQPMIVAMDDSLLRKTGPRIHGVAYRRDPLGPPFQTNLVRGQRVLQLSAALPQSDRPEAARMIPIDFRHVPTPAKPASNAAAAQWADYHTACRQNRISGHGLQRIAQLRHNLDQDGAEQRPLWVVVDGRFTNRTVMKKLPDRTVFIGRIRSDAKLYHLPEDSSGPLGRKKIYGPQAPTPEQLRQSEDFPWQNVPAWACGKMHDFRLKVLQPLRWRPTSDQVNVQIVVIAPLAYRLTKGGRVLYRKPAYLVCTDPDLSLQQLLQAYLWRWDIEVNFRDQKTLLGVGQAQVRNSASTESVPALTVAAYSLLLLAAHRSLLTSSGCLPPPKWRQKTLSPKRRPSLCDLIGLLRHDLWADSIRAPHFSHFSSHSCCNQKSEKLLPSLPGALFYAPA